MAQTGTNNQTSKTTLKVVVPEELKGALQEMAHERNISLSALLRLIASTYVKRNNHP